MGAYGSPQIGIYAENNSEKKKLSNPILIVIDAVALFLVVLLWGSVALSEHSVLFSVYFLLTYGLTIGLTVGFFKKIRENVNNSFLFLFLCGMLCLLYLIFFQIV